MTVKQVGEPNYTGVTKFWMEKNERGGLYGKVHIITSTRFKPCDCLRCFTVRVRDVADQTKGR